MVEDEFNPDDILEYKGYYIEPDFYGHGEFTVQYLGDDLMFDSVDEAKAFIDEVSAE